MNIEAATVIADAQTDVLRFKVSGYGNGLRPGMMNDVRNGFLKNTKNVQYPFRAEVGDLRQLLYLPVETQAVLFHELLGAMTK